MSNDTAKLPMIVKVAAGIAFLLGLVAVAESFGQPFFVISAVISFWAGVGILRRRSWSAYGFALVQAAPIFIIVLLVRGADTRHTIELFGTGVFEAMVSTLFIFAGRSLTASGATQGLVWPWIVLAVVQTVPFIFVRAYVMPSGSMENTILIGDHLSVQVFPEKQARDGDIVVFKYPMDHAQTFVKRVVGAPGDHIHISSRAVYRNGSKVSEPYVLVSFPGDDRRDNFPLNPPDSPSGMDVKSSSAVREMIGQYVANGELTVPPGKYFVLGDNRDNSLDSRYWGLVDRSEIIGEPFIIYYSEAAPTGGPSIFSRAHVRWERFMKLL